MEAEEKSVVETNMTDKKDEQITLNEYSIYDYLKKTPSVLIAALSAIVAVVTFFSKALAILSIQKELAFWGIDPAFSSFGGDSIIFRATASVLYSFGIILVSLWFSTTYEAYVPYKRCEMALQYYIKSKKEEIKRIKEKRNEENLSEEEVKYFNAFTMLCSSTKEYVSVARRKLLLNLAPIIIILCFIYLMYFGTSTSYWPAGGWLTAIICALIQVLSFWLVSRILSSKSIDKKFLKENTAIHQLIEELNNHQSADEFPIGKLFSAGLRSVMKNITIVLIVVALFLNCFLVIVLHAVVPEKPDLSDATMRVVEMDGVDYALVFQTEDKYFLEVAEIREEQGEAGIEYVLTVYKDQQRILSINDISFVTYEFREIIPTLSN